MAKIKSKVSGVVRLLFYQLHHSTTHMPAAEKKFSDLDPVMKLCLIH